jgi:uncharacterized repeat protein (TIGR03803 family)
MNLLKTCGKMLALLRIQGFAIRGDSMSTKASLLAGWPLTLSGVILLLATTLAQGSTLTVLHNFAGGSDGQYPASSLIFDTAGNLYGTTMAGGTGPCGGGCGTVFELTPNGAGFTESIVYNFQGSANDDGQNPQGALTADESGNFYGVTSAGGLQGCGTVFKLTPASGGGWTESVIYSFCAKGNSSDGAFPTGKLIFDASGNLYGVTAQGGAHVGGVVFQLKPSSRTWTNAVLYSFPRAGYLDGSEPAGIILDAAGNIDGVTLFGGTRFYNGAGVVFQLVQNPPGHWTEKVIHRFGINGTNLQTPTGGLIFDTSGNLYMTMGRGGRGGAGVFELSPQSRGGFTGHKLYSFRGSQTLQGYEELVFDSAGNLYSASFAGEGKCRNSGCGFIYELSPASSHWTGARLARMHGTDGATPIGGVILDSKGNLYGAAFRGGSDRSGVVFQITP